MSGPATGGHGAGGAGVPPWPESDPWRDPATPTERGEPYAGPPVTAPPIAVWPGGYGPYPYGGHPPVALPWSHGAAGPWGPSAEQPPPRRPGTVVGAAVLAFVQAALVLLASIYVFMFATLLGMADPGGGVPGGADLAREGTILTVVQILSAILLVVAGIRALTARTRSAWTLLVVALGAQAALAGYWAVRLTGMANDMPGPDGSQGALAAGCLFFAAAPLVGLGLVLAGAGRRWFRDPAGG